MGKFLEKKRIRSALLSLVNTPASRSNRTVYASWGTDKKIILKLEVPGIEEKDLDVRVENSTLTVKGERKFEKEEKEENFHRIERRYGSFYRAFTLPPTVNTEHVDAGYNNGILKLELKKKPEAQPKQIKVNVGKLAA